MRVTSAPVMVCMPRPGYLSELHRSAQVIVVCEGQGPVAQLPGAHQDFIGGRGALLEGIVAVAVELSVGAAHSPCRYQPPPTRSRKMVVHLQSSVVTR